MKFLKLLVAIAFIIGPVCAFGQQTSSADSLLNCMTGKWLLKGTIDGAKIEHDITVAWVLGHQYIQLKETSREKKTDGTPFYEALVFISFDKALNQYHCLWLDNTSNKGLSNQIVAHAALEPNRIAFLFKFNDHSFFHTTFAYNAVKGTWHWLMEGNENGKKDIFSDAVMSKLP